MATDCILTTYALEANGYARQRINGKRILVHRLAYAKHHKLSLAELEGKVVMHTCDNRACVNPNHLVLGTQSENIKDMWDKGRFSDATAKAMWNGKFTEQEIIDIRNKAGKQQYKDVAAEYGIAPTTVADIFHRRIYAWVK